MIILDGKQTSLEIKNQIASQVEKMKAAGQREPHLAAVLVGDDPASQAYIRNKVKSCQEVGFKSTLKHFNSSVSEEELLEIVTQINSDPQIDGLLVQLPLPDHISVEKVTFQIRPEKDVDGFHPVNVGRMAKNLPSFSR